jgi:hypothetical protein
MILPHLLAPKPNRRRPADLPPGSAWNTGAELQYLEPYQPFPYGISTFALGYNYARRAQVLQSVGKQSPLQVSDAVIDSRPAVELAGWAADEWERGRVFEMQAFGVRPPAERLQMEAPTAAAPPDATKLVDPASVAPAVYSYQMTERLGNDAKALYFAHLTNPAFFDRTTNYRSHIDTMEAMSVIASADADYLRATVLAANDPAREKLLAESARKYQEAIGAYQRIILKWYVNDEIVAAAYGPDLNRANIEQQPREVQDRVMQAVRQAIAARGPNEHDEDVQEYESHIARATTRLGQLLRR